MKEYEVTVTLRNNLLKERRTALGLSQRELSAKIGCTLVDYSALECLRKSPFKKLTQKGGTRKNKVIMMRWRSLALKLSNFYNIRPEDLFPEDADTIKKNNGVMKIDRAELEALSLTSRHEKTLPALTESTEDKYIKDELMQNINRAFETLTPREADVLRLRLGFEDGTIKTLEEIASMQNVTRQRIRQVEAKAFRKLRIQVGVIS